MSKYSFLPIKDMKKNALYTYIKGDRSNLSCFYDFSFLDDMQEIETEEEKQHVINDILKQLSNTSGAAFCIPVEKQDHFYSLDFDFNIYMVENDIKRLYRFYALEGCRISKHNYTNIYHTRSSFDSSRIIGNFRTHLHDCIYHVCIETSEGI